MGSGEGSGWYYKAAAVAATATLAAGAGYVIYRYARTVTEDDDDEPEQPPLSMQALLTGGATGPSAAPRSAGTPTLPVRKTPSPNGAKKGAGPSLPRKAPAAGGSGSAEATAAAANGAAGASASAPKPASANLKACACCDKPLTGLPQRCSKCKSVYYCSQQCQKKHWTDHKASCSQGGAKGAPSTTSPPAEATSPVAGSPAGASRSLPAEQPAAAADSPSTSGDASAGGKGSGGLQGALVEVLRQAAEKGAGTLDGRFEEAVMHFLGGDLQSALAAFLSLQADARAEKRADLLHELNKWLGHTHSKLGNFTKAADAFSTGMEEAKAAGLTNARVDCAIGLGNLWKLTGQYTKAAEVLKEALLVSQEAGNAGMQSECLVALGNVIMVVEPEEGLECLQIAVKLREDEVAKALESGDRAAMATGMMQSAAALVNMAAALFATKRYAQAKQAYEQAAEIFELMEDTDKVIQVLINLANLTELQLDLPEEALEYRKKLAALLKEAGHPGIAGGNPAPSCAVCAKPVQLFGKRAKGDEESSVLLLACLHAQHDPCFRKWVDEGHDAVTAATSSGPAAAVAAASAPGTKRTSTCPTCKEPVPVL